MRSSSKTTGKVLVFILWCGFAPALAEERVAPPSRATHPMDALTADEITAAAGILRAAGKLDGGARIVSLTMEENAKTEVIGWTSGKPFSRRAFAVVLVEGMIGEATIDLDRQALNTWNLITNRQAAVTFDEFLSV